VDALGLASWQYIEGRRRTKREHARLGTQREWRQAATHSRIVAAETADHIGQRAKVRTVRKTGLGELARVLRRQLADQVRQMQQATAVVEQWQIGKTIDSSAASHREAQELPDAHQAPDLRAVDPGTPPDASTTTPPQQQPPAAA
jgi:hypothetical protein